MFVILLALGLLVGASLFALGVGTLRPAALGLGTAAAVVIVLVAPADVSDRMAVAVGILMGVLVSATLLTPGDGSRKETSEE